MIRGVIRDASKTVACCWIAFASTEATAQREYDSRNIYEYENCTRDGYDREYCAYEYLGASFLDNQCKVVYPDKGSEVPTIDEIMDCIDAGADPEFCRNSYGRPRIVCYSEEYRPDDPPYRPDPPPPPPPRSAVPDHRPPPPSLDRPANCDFPDGPEPYTDEDRAEAAEAANDGVQTFRRLAGIDGAAEIFALPANANIQTAQVDQGLPARIIPLDRFQDHVVCPNVRRDELPVIFNRSEQFLFTVTIDGAPRATIRTARLEDAYEAVEFGLPVLTAQIAAAKALILERFCVAPEDIEFVEFPGANAEFLVFRCGRDVWMTPLGDDAPYMKAGKFYRAARVRMLLTQHALNHTGEPD